MIHESTERKAADTKRRPLNPAMVASKSSGPESYRAAALRQRVGNQGIQRLMGEVSGNARGASPLHAPSIQAKLTISEPGDTREREVDRVANAVLRMPTSEATDRPVAASTASTAKMQRLCTECKEEKKNTAGAQVRRREQAADAPPVTSSVVASIHSMRSGGSALPTATRAFFEPRFGTDFSSVRVHTDARAAQTAASINAKAFTVADTVVFGVGHYAPDSNEGRRLLAHELTHVVQQGGGGTVDDGSVGAEHVQRTIGDKHDLSSPRFAGDADLEACYDDEARLTMNGQGKPGTIKIEHGPAVKKVQQALIDLGYLAPGLANGNYTKPTWDAVKALKKKEGLGWETMGDVGPGTMDFLDKKFPPATCPPCPSTAPRPAGCAPCPPVKCPPCPSTAPRPAGCPPCGAPSPSPHVCGPDIDAALTKVLGDMQAHFRGLGRWAKHWSCQWLITPPMARMAWDIRQLFLPKTGWLRMSPFRPACGHPPAAPSDVEDPATCSNSVRVGGKCNLAGTANYATFGIMARECHSYYSGSPALWSWKANIPSFTETGMKAYIGAYKTATSDDSGPPKEFAVATYKGGPSGRPSTENRSHCSATCPSTHAPPAFTFVWEPYQAR